MVTQLEIDELMASAKLEVFASFGKAVVVVAMFPTRGGFVLSGMGACVSPDDFNYEVGRYEALKKIEDQLWQLEGYRQQLTIYG